MEEVRQVALAYYHNFSEDEQYEAFGAFMEMDSNGDGTISIREYEENFGTGNRRLFREVDMNGDGRLDFEEFITLYYLVNAGMVLCDGHGCKVNFLKGLYFTCVDCFHHSETNTFDLCTSCYRNGNYVHHHTSFLDSHLLLRCKASYLQPSSLDYQIEDEADEFGSCESSTLDYQADEFGYYKPSYREPSYTVKRPVSDKQSYREPSHTVKRSVSKKSSYHGPSYAFERDASEKPSYPEPSNAVERSKSKREIAMKVFHGVNAGVTIGQAVVSAAGFCSIM